MRLEWLARGGSAARREAPAFLVSACGLGFLWQLMRTRALAAALPGLPLRWGLAVLAGTLACLCLAARARPGRPRPSPGAVAALSAAAGALVIACGRLPSAGVPGPAVAACSAAALALYAACLLALLSGWARACEALFERGPRKALACLLASELLGLLFSYVLIYPLGSLGLVSAVSPAASAGLLAAASMLLQDARGPGAGASARPARAPMPRSLTAAVVVLFIGSTLLSDAVYYLTGDEGAYDIRAMHAVTVLVLAASAALVLPRGDARLGVYRVQLFLSAVMICAPIALGAAGSIGTPVGLGIVAAVGSCAEALLLFCAACGRGADGAARGAALMFLLPSMCCDLAGEVALPLLAGALGLSARLGMGAVAVAFGVGFLTYSMVALGRLGGSALEVGDARGRGVSTGESRSGGTGAGSASAGGPADESPRDQGGKEGSPADAREIRLDELAANFGLTAREREVAGYILRGYTAKGIGSALGLSASTVQGYSRSLYRKAGVHSRQQLVSLVEDGETRAER